MPNKITDHQFEEYCEYITENRLSKQERHLLHEWMLSGHSVYDTVDSRYLSDPAYPPMDVIDAYRLDRSLGEVMKGMSNEERIEYLRSYKGYTDPMPAASEGKLTGRCMSKPATDYIGHLEREVFYLWNFIWQEGYGDEAAEFIREHQDDAFPFERPRPM